MPADPTNSDNASRRDRALYRAGGPGAIKQMLLAEYRHTGFVGRAPCTGTLKNWIRRRQLPGAKICGTWVVFVDADGNPAWPARQRTGNTLADSALQRWQSERPA